MPHLFFNYVNMIINYVTILFKITKKFFQNFKISTFLYVLNEKIYLGIYIFYTTIIYKHKSLFLREKSERLLYLVHVFFLQKDKK